MMKSSIFTELNNFEEQILEEDLLILESGKYILSAKKRINLDIDIGENIDVLLSVKLDRDIKTLNIIINKHSKLGLNIINKTEYLNININVLEESNVDAYLISFKENSKTLTNINLLGYLANINYNLGLYASNKDKHIHDTHVNHLAKSTHSNIIKRVILNDYSECDLNIQSHIEKKYSASSTYQNSKIINLSDNTKSNINPILLIDEYDVMGGHGATISKVSEDDLYYLQSRGIPLNEATKLISLGNLFDNMPSYLKDEIGSLIERKINNERIS